MINVKASINVYNKFTNFCEKGSVQKKKIINLQYDKCNPNISKNNKRSAESQLINIYDKLDNDAKKFCEFYIKYKKQCNFKYTVTNKWNNELNLTKILEFAEALSYSYKIGGDNSDTCNALRIILECVSHSLSFSSNNWIYKKVYNFNNLIKWMKVFSKIKIRDAQQQNHLLNIAKAFNNFYDSQKNKFKFTYVTLKNCVFFQQHIYSAQNSKNKIYITFSNNINALKLTSLPFNSYSKYKSLFKKHLIQERIDTLRKDTDHEKEEAIDKVLACMKSENVNKKKSQELIKSTQYNNGHKGLIYALVAHKREKIITSLARSVDFKIRIHKKKLEKNERQQYLNIYFEFDGPLHTLDINEKIKNHKTISRNAALMKYISEKNINAKKNKDHKKYFLLTYGQNDLFELVKEKDTQLNKPFQVLANKFNEYIDNLETITKDKTFKDRRNVVTKTIKKNAQSKINNPWFNNNQLSKTKKRRRKKRKKVKNNVF